MRDIPRVVITSLVGRNLGQSELGAGPASAALNTPRPPAAALMRVGAAPLAPLVISLHSTTPPLLSRCSQSNAREQITIGRTLWMLDG